MGYCSDNGIKKPIDLIEIKVDDNLEMARIEFNEEFIIKNNITPMVLEELCSRLGISYKTSNYEYIE